MARQNTQPKELLCHSWRQPSKILVVSDILSDNTVGASMPAATLPQESSACVERQFTLRCFVYFEKATGLFVAECIDLDLIVKARKPNKAMRELRDAVLGYVKVAVESGQDAALIPRPSPLTHRLHYSFVRFAAHLSLLGKSQIFDCTPSAHTRCYA